MAPLNRTKTSQNSMECYVQLGERIDTHATRIRPQNVTETMNGADKPPRTRPHTTKIADKNPHTTKIADKNIDPRHQQDIATGHTNTNRDRDNRAQTNRAQTTPHPQQRKKGNIKILQLNGRGCQRISGEIRQAAAEQNIDILLIQDPYSKLNNNHYMLCDTGRTIKTAATRKEKPMALVAICNRNLDIVYLPKLSTTHCACAEISTQDGTIYAISHYFQWKDDIEKHLDHLQKVLTTLKGKRIILGIDTNSESGLWSPRGTTADGEKIEQLIRKFNLTSINNKFAPPTFEDNDKKSYKKSYIDVTLVSEAMLPMVKDWKVQREWTTSDHNSIEINIDIRDNSQTRETGKQHLNKQRFNTKKADWEKFRRTLIEQSIEKLANFDPTDEQEVEEIANKLTEAMIHSCEVSMPRKKAFNNSNPWWKKELTEMKRKVHRSKRAIRKEKDPNKGQELHKVHKNNLRTYSKATRAAKKESLQNYVTEDSNKDPWGHMYKRLAGKIKVEEALSAITKPEDTQPGEHIPGMQETAERLMETHFPEDKLQDDTEEQRKTRIDNLREPNTEDAPPFTEEEIKSAIKKFENGKAPGPDEIEVEVLKMAFKTIPGRFKKVYNSCLEFGIFPTIWKEAKLRIISKGADKNPEDPKSYRPISLLSVTGKLLERLIALRLAESVLSQGKISDAQFGFRQNRSTEDAIAELRRIVERSEKKIVAALLFDIKGAFDSIWRDFILQSLKQNGCQRNIYNLLFNYFKNREILLQWAGNEIRKLTNRGCPQGSILGPLSWILAFNRLLKTLEIETNNKFVAYADDLLVVLEGNSREEIEKQGNHVVKIIQEWCKTAKLEISETKTEGIYLKDESKKKGKRKHPKHSVDKKFPSSGSKRYPIIKTENQQTIKFKETVRYLGLHFDRGMKVHSHCAYLKNKITPLYEGLRKIARTTWGLRYGSLEIIHKGVFAPTITYAAAGWADLCTQNDLDTLNGAQRQALISITRAYRTTSTDAVNIVAGEMPIDILLKERKAKYEMKTSINITYNGRIIACNHDTLTELRAESVSIWQDRWTKTNKGRTTYQFYKSVRSRLQTDWLKPCHYTSQVLTGHGNFNSRLNSLGLNTTINCDCGAEDTIWHTIFECDIFSPQREAAEEILQGKKWPNDAHTLVDNKESFELLRDLAREILYIKSSLHDQAGHEHIQRRQVREEDTQEETPATTPPQHTRSTAQWTHRTRNAERVRPSSPGWDINKPSCSTWSEERPKRRRRNEEYDSEP